MDWSPAHSVECDALNGGGVETRIIRYSVIDRPHGGVDNITEGWHATRFPLFGSDGDAVDAAGIGHSVHACADKPLFSLISTRLWSVGRDTFVGLRSFMARC